MQWRVARHVPARRAVNQKPATLRHGTPARPKLRFASIRLRSPSAREPLSGGRKHLSVAGRRECFCSAGRSEKEKQLRFLRALAPNGKSFCGRRWLHDARPKQNACRTGCSAIAAWSFQTQAESIRAARCPGQHKTGTLAAHRQPGQTAPPAALARSAVAAARQAEDKILASSLCIPPPAALRSTRSDSGHSPTNRCCRTAGNSNALP